MLVGMCGGKAIPPRPPVHANRFSHHDAIQPPSHATRLTKGRPSLPGLLHRRLDRVLREDAAPADEACEADHSFVVRIEECRQLILDTGGSRDGRLGGGATHRLDCLAHREHRTVGQPFRVTDAIRAMRFRRCWPSDCLTVGSARCGGRAMKSIHDPLRGAIRIGAMGLTALCRVAGWSRCCPWRISA